MKKLFLTLLLVASIPQVAKADGAKVDPKPEAKSIQIQGTLIDTSCYFSEGQKEDEHDGMKACGKSCLESGIPAGVLVGDKVYILIFPAKAFADYVGKTVQIKGEPYGDDLVHPTKASVVDKDGKKPIKLTGFEMM